MPCFICVTCGTQFAETLNAPAHCPICEDPRQYVPPGGQKWTTLDELRATHKAVIRPQYELTGIGIEPKFGIGQRALLVTAPGGNVLWDCVSLLNEEIVAAVRAQGGVSAIAISHPHYYTGMVEWSRAFDDAPIYLHAADRQWVMRPDANIVFWDGDTRVVSDGLTLIRCGGHYAGGAVLHCAATADRPAALLTGDIIQTVPDRRYVSFMYSYPNLIPLSAPAVRHIAHSVRPFAFARIYGAWWDQIVPADGAEVVARSAQRYCDALADGQDSRDTSMRSDI